MAACCSPACGTSGADLRRCAVSIRGSTMPAIWPQETGLVIRGRHRRRCSTDYSRSACARRPRKHPLRRQSAEFATAELRLPPATRGNVATRLENDRVRSLVNPRGPPRSSTWIPRSASTTTGRLRRRTPPAMRPGKAFNCQRRATSETSSSVSQFVALVFGDATPGRRRPLLNTALPNGATPDHGRGIPGRSVASCAQRYTAASGLYLIGRMATCWAAGATVVPSTSPPYSATLQRTARASRPTELDITYTALAGLFARR